MTALILATCAVIGFASPKTLTVQETPFKAPAGWKADKQDGATTIFTPGDVPQGKFYVVMITMMKEKAGSLDDILADGKKMAGEVGPFKAMTKPEPFVSSGEWDYSFVLGTIEKGDRNLVAQVMAIKKGDQGGVIVVLSESVETMSLYADAFNVSVKGMGGPKRVAVPAASTGKVDLQYNVPSGWVKQEVNGFPLLVKQKHDFYNNYRLSLLILPTEVRSGSVREQFVGYWNTLITPNYDTKIAPMPMMVRLKSGYACAFDGDFLINSLVTVALYMFVQGGKVVPVMAIYSGAEWSLNNDVETEVSAFLDTARLPGVSGEKVPLFSAPSLAGDWKESGTSYANYVTRGGVYAGDATISTATYLTLGSDGSYGRTAIAVGAAGNIREKEAGTWSVDDDEIVLSKGGRYSLLGYGDDPKVGRFLILGSNRDQRARLKFTNPRGILQAQWFKAK